MAVCGEPVPTEVACERRLLFDKRGRVREFFDRGEIFRGKESDSLMATIFIVSYVKATATAACGLCAAAKPQQVLSLPCFGSIDRNNIDEVSPAICATSCACENVRNTTDRECKRNRLEMKR
ncbi:hypothetical protein PV326_005980 [Microctonus aethiopoides]|nr:hypothetical protein PV326_005980 [Microctonus aethiopoides]